MLIHIMTKLRNSEISIMIVRYLFYNLKSFLKTVGLDIVKPMTITYKLIPL